jgi:hypothetical protein
MDVRPRGAAALTTKLSVRNEATPVGNADAN